MKNTDNKSFSIVRILIIGALLLTAGGVVVWKEKVAFIPSPVPSMNPSPSLTTPVPSPTQPETNLISCQIDRDCPPSLGCVPLKACPTWKCVNSQCVKVDDENTLWRLTNSMRCQKDQDCAYVCGHSKLAGNIQDYPQPFSWCVNKDYLKNHLVACLDVATLPLGTCRCLNERCQLIPN